MMKIAYRVVFVGDPAVGHLEFVSEAAAALIGLEPDDVVTHPGRWTSAIHPDDVDEFVQTPGQVILTGTPSIRTYRLRHPDVPAHRMVEDRLTPILRADGSVAGYEAVVTLAS